MAEWLYAVSPLLCSMFNDGSIPVQSLLKFMAVA